MSIVTTPDVIENITEYCDVDRVHAWELYEEWVEDEYDYEMNEAA